MATRMARYDVRNDGVGPYAIFYCDRFNREYRSQPDVGNTITKDIGRDVLGGFLRTVPLVGGAVADGVVGQDPRYTYSLTPQQLDAAWKQVEQYFRECPKCHQIVCLSDFDSQSGFCNDDSPRRGDIARASGAGGGCRQGLRQRVRTGRCDVEGGRGGEESDGAGRALPQRWDARQAGHEVLS